MTDNTDPTSETTIKHEPCVPTVPQIIYVQHFSTTELFALLLEGEEIVKATSFIDSRDLLLPEPSWQEDQIEWARQEWHARHFTVVSDAEMEHRRILAETLMRKVAPEEPTSTRRPKAKEQTILATSKDTPLQEESFVRLGSCEVRLSYRANLFNLTPSQRLALVHFLDAFDTLKHK